MNEFVLAGTYDNRLTADLIQAYLKEAGISAIIQADDGGGVMPYLSFSNGVKIFVQESDLEEAQKVMERHRQLDSE